MFVVRRSNHNPILTPEHTRSWEGLATFNWSPVRRNKTIYAFYRALSLPDPLSTPESISTIGLAQSADGFHFENRKQFIVPEHEWEKFGCEDPRVTEFEGNYYIFYTALSKFPFVPEGIKVGVAKSKDLTKVDEKHLVTPFNAKAMALFPERIGGKLTVIFSAHTDPGPAKIAVAQFEKEEELWNEEFWEKWHEKIDEHVVNLRRTEFDQVEIGAPPVKTDRGWLLIYSHIQNFFGGGFPRLFGIEAVLLDLKNPRKILGRTHGPFLVPEEPYEKSGQVPNVIFPSGALIDGEKLSIYYGGADTTCSRAQINLGDLLSSIWPDTIRDWHFKRSSDNPIISPDKNRPWEAKAVFNPAAIDLDGRVHILYRAMSEDNTSVLGYASSKDGFKIDERLPDPVYLPRETFEMKITANANSGCEDPRLTKIGERLYLTYTAFDGIGPAAVAVSSISERDFLSHNWNWSKPFLLTPQGVDDKDTCILPERINNKFMVLHRIGTDVCADYLETLDFEKEKVRRCIKVLSPRESMWDSEKVGITAPPLKTPDGWLLIYHARSKTHHTYRLGAALLDLADPTVVLARSTDPIFEPEEEYEKTGLVGNVVFPCGIIERNGTLFMYYGAADQVVGLATMKLEIILSSLKRRV